MNKVFAASGLWLLAAGVAAAQHAIVPYPAVPFAQDADVACLASALETGNPSAGPSTFILKAPPGLRRAVALAHRAGAAHGRLR